MHHIGYVFGMQLEDLELSMFEGGDAEIALHPNVIELLTQHWEDNFRDQDNDTFEDFKQDVTEIEVEIDGQEVLISDLPNWEAEIQRLYESFHGPIAIEQIPVDMTPEAQME